MDSFELAFKILAILHGLVGLFFWSLAADEDFQQFCFYAKRNPLAGDCFKYLVYFACWALIACGVVAFFLPTVAVVLAWLSLTLYLSTGLVDLIANGRWPAFCKGCAISFVVRTVFAVALTGSLYLSVYG